MNYRKTLAALAAAFIFCVPLSAQTPVRLVSTLQGTDSDKSLSHGNTWPCATMPHAVHGWSPRTRPYGEMEKYVWRDTEIVGFDLTHMCNMWLRDYDVLTLMPELGEPVHEGRARAAAFSHASETALPHYYAVKLDNGIKVEIAPTERCAHLRFTYPKGKGTPSLVLDGSAGESHFEADADGRTLRGWVLNLYWDNAARTTMKCYFTLHFDRPFKSFETAAGHASVRFAGAGAVQAKIACSFVSPEMAQLQFEREIAADKTLEQTRSRGEKVWNERLGRIKIEGGTQEQQRTFYSCLYHAECFPHMLHEYRADGQPVYFSPYDAKVHEGKMYTDCGLWDAWHSLMPLRCLIDPDEQGDYVASLVDAAGQYGWLPATSCPGETGMMTGNHAISVLADAWAKGIHTFDPARALQAYLHDVTNKGAVLDAIGRAESADWFALGFVPEQEGRGCSTSKTLEYSYDDFCAWRLASATGNEVLAEAFGRQMRNYANVFDPATGFMRGRLRDGSWSEPFDPLAWDGYFPFESRAYCEGNAWQWTWAVPHDIRGLAELFGSYESFLAKLDAMFATQSGKAYGRWAELKDNEMMDLTGDGFGQYAHGNEPVHHLPYLYTFAGQPWKTQAIVRKIMDNLYASGPKGFPGDEDQGAMSAWYVLSAAGLYCVTPGTDQYVIGSPLFDKITIAVSGGSFTVEAEGNSPANVYIQSAQLNGSQLDRNYLTHEEICAGGTLRLVMGPEPCTNRGTALASAPYSLSDKDLWASFSPLAYEADGPAYDAATQYRNPVLPGFYPDPSICRVGDDYWMTNSCFQYFPALPVWHSTDLIHWEQVGSVLDSDSKIQFRERMMEFGTFAPQISYNPHNSKYYVVCTQVEGDLGNFFCTSDDPRLGWSDPIRLPEVDGIDPSFFFDEDGTAVITSATSPENGGGKGRYPGDGAIVMREFDWRTGKTVGAPHIAAQSGARPELEPKSLEGPHIYKVNGKYFLMCAEGGTERGHSEVIFESESLRGLFKPCATNPILTQRDQIPGRPDPVSCTGHADLVQSAAGNWYAVFLGCRPYVGEETFNTGRETFLLPVSWKDGQPVILPAGESVPLVVDVPAELLKLAKANKIKGFDGYAPGPLWSAEGLAPFALTVRGSQEANTRFAPDGTMRLKCAGVPLGALGRPAAVFERITSATFRAETVMEFEPVLGSEAGLICWHDDDHYMKLSKTLGADGKPVLRLEKRDSKRNSELYCLLFHRPESSIDYSIDVPLEGEAASEPLTLRVEAVDATHYVFSYAVGKGPFVAVGEPLDGVALSTMTCGGFQGAMVGVFAL